MSDVDDFDHFHSFVCTIATVAGCVMLGAFVGLALMSLAVWVADLIAWLRRGKKMEPKQAAQQQAEAKQEKPAPTPGPKPAADLGDLMIELARWQGRKAAHESRPGVAYDVVGGQAIDGRLHLRLQGTYQHGKPASLLVPADEVKAFEARTFEPISLDAKPLTMGAKFGQSKPLAPGDVVRLKSGGPAMTVSGIEGDLAYCEWFEGGGVTAPGQVPWSDRHAEIAVVALVRCDAEG